MSPQNAQTTIDWIFDPLPPSGQLVGGVPTVHVFRPDLDIFVREVLQNSHDQSRPDREQPVEVKFSFHDLSGDHRSSFLSAIGWSELRRHLAGAARGRSVMANRISQSLTDLQSRPLTILRIDDSGTWGLTGGENERRTNFTALCRNVLDTTDGQPSKGGSYGLGKAVLWRFSAFSTVLFSSRIDGLPRAGFRYFGRAELPYHEVEGTSWSGPGWFGAVEEVAAGRRAVSVWDEVAESVARRSHLFRGVHLNTGTSILVFGFQEPGHTQPRPTVDVARDILDSATRWFWPSISLEPATLRVTAEVLENGVSMFRGEATPGRDIQPFVHAVQAESLLETATAPGDVAEARIQLTVPGRRDGDGDAVVADTILRVTRGEAGPTTRTTNTVALVRGAGMVVDYRIPARRPLSDLPFYGVLRTGEFAGESPADVALERFLRAAEPPAHNAWEHTTERIQVEYKQGAKAQLDRLWLELGKEVLRLCERSSPPTGQGPAALSRLFPMGSSGGGTVASSHYRTDQLRADFRDGVWTFDGRIRRDGRDTTPWRVDLTLWLDGETGRGTSLPIEALSVAGQGTEVRTGNGPAVILVAASTGEVRFHGRTVRLSSDGEMPDARRTRVRIDVLARKRPSE